LNCIPTGGIEDIEDSNSTQVAKRYSLREIIDATNNFEKILGEGGFARVYYGKLADGKEVAVKKLNLNILREEDSQFFNEVHSDKVNLQTLTFAYTSIKFHKVLNCSEFWSLNIPNKILKLCSND
jgi:serine/threonine protein kinase